MASPLQIDVTLLDLVGGNKRPQLGWMMEGAPRSAARHRQPDQLLLFIALDPSPGAPHRLYEALLTAAYDAYFRSTGTITASARDAITATNHQLKIIPNAAGSRATITCAVVKDNELYVVQAGASHCFVLRNNAVDDFSLLPELTRPLDGETTPDFHYSHNRLTGNEYILVAPFTSHSITDARMQRISLGSPRVFVSMLLKELGPDFRALAGHLTVEHPSQTMSHAARFAAERLGIQPKAAAPEPPVNIQHAIAKIDGNTPANAVAPNESLIDSDTKELILGQEPQFNAPVDTSDYIPEATAADVPESFTQEVQTAAAGWIDSTPEPAPHPSAAKSHQASVSAEPVDAEFEHAEPREPIIEQVRYVVDSFKDGVRNWFVNLPLVNLRDSVENGVGGLTGSITGSSRNLADRLAPSRQQDEKPLSPQLLLSVAILIPLAIGMLAAVIVIRFGRATQYETHYELAVQQATNARAAPDQVLARNAWYDVIRELNIAATFRPNEPAIATLRLDAEQALDQIENVVRVKGTQTVDVSELPRGFEIDHIVYNDGSVYVADRDIGSVYRFARGSDSVYVLDTDFNCNARGNDEQFNSVIDLAVHFHPRGNGALGVIAVGDNGYMAYCAEGLGMMGKQLESLASGWGRPTKIEVFADTLYLLNPAFQAIWVYEPSGALGSFSPQPVDYFGADKPDLVNVVDFTIGNGEVYMLTETGQTWRCSRAGADGQADCALLVFQDSRPDFADGERIVDIQQPAVIQYTAPPESSLYIVDSNTYGFYRVSTDGVLQVKYKPPTYVEGRPTAFAAGNAKEIFYATGAQLYASQRP